MPNPVPILLAMQYSRFASDENRVFDHAAHARFTNDENAVPQGPAGLAGSKLALGVAESVQTSGRRVALGDVTSQANKQAHGKPGVLAHAHSRHASENHNGPATAQLEHTGAQPMSPPMELRSPEKMYSDDTLQGADHVGEDFNDDTSSVSSDSEPLLLVSTEESMRAVQLANQEFYSESPDPLDEDTYDLVMVVEYTQEVFQYLHELEEKYRPHPRYMHFQPELKWSYRSTLIDWIVQVHARFQLLPETLYLTVNIIDRFLSRKTVTLNRFQLVGAAALFLAAKFEEINCPTLKEILYMLDNSYTKDELLRAERYMINTLEFELGWPGPMSFLRRVSKADDYEYDIRTLAKYLLETTIMDCRLVSAQPSWLAAGAYYLSRVILGFNNWTKQHIYCSGYTAEQLFPLATIILENCRHASKRHQAIFEKYSERRHRRSSQVVARWIAMAEERIS